MLLFDAKIKALNSILIACVKVLSVYVSIQLNVRLTHYMFHMFANSTDAFIHSDTQMRIQAQPVMGLRAVLRGTKVTPLCSPQDWTQQTSDYRCRNPVSQTLAKRMDQAK